MSAERDNPSIEPAEMVGFLASALAEMNTNNQTKTLQLITAMALRYSLSPFDFKVVKTPSHDQEETSRLTAVYAAPEGIESGNWHQLRPQMFWVPRRKTNVRIGHTTRHAADLSFDIYKSLVHGVHGEIDVNSRTYLTGERSVDRHYGASNELLPVGFVDAKGSPQKDMIYRQAQGGIKFRSALLIGSQPN